MIILGLDFETTGLEPTTDRVIEIGAVLWDTERKAPLQVQSDFILHKTEENVTIPEEIQKITGILPEDLTRFGLPAKQAFERLNHLISFAEYVVAHNGNEFDQKFYQAEVARLKIDEDLTPWIDTMTDIPFSEDFKTRKLTYLAAEHGFLNPFSHRAAFDVLTMLKVLEPYDLGQVTELAKSPTLTVKAAVSYDDREKAKARGYRWNPKDKIWVKTIKEVFLENERVSADFDVVPLH